MIETRLLRQFIVVAEELHFRRAAERLHMAQPPLSQAIRRLEEVVGFPLFERTNRRVELTAAGVAFLGRAREILAALDDGLAHTRRIAQGIEGHLRLSLINLTPYPLIWRALRAFRASAPAVEVSLIEATTQEQMLMLEGAESDLGLLRTPGTTHPELEIETILREPLQVALPIAHPLASAQTVPLECLRNEAFVGSPRALGRGFHDQLVALCQSAGFTPRVVQQARQMQTVVGLVASGFGVALVPASFVPGDWDEVVVRPIESEAPEALRFLNLEMAWSHPRASPVRDSLIAHIRQAVLISDKS